MILVKILPRLASCAPLRCCDVGPFGMAGHASVNLLRRSDRRLYGPHQSPCSNRPDRRKATACVAANGDSSRPLWLAGTTTWSASPARRVSATATVPSLTSRRPPKNWPSPSGRASRDHAHLRVAAPRLAAAAQQVRAAAERHRERVAQRQPFGGGTAAQGRAQAHDAPDRQIRLALQGGEGHQPAQAVGHHVGAFAQQPRQAWHRRLGSAGDRGIAEQPGGEAGTLQPARQRQHRKPRHPQAVDEDDRPAHAGASARRRRMNSWSRTRPTGKT